MVSLSAAALSGLRARLFSEDPDQRSQAHELIRAMAGPDPLARARIYADAGAILDAIAEVRSGGLVLPGAQTRLLACAFADRAVAYAAQDVTPPKGSPARDPRCDQVLAGVEAIARGDQPIDLLERLLPVARVALRTGWWEAEAVYGLLDGDPLRALEHTVRSLHNLTVGLHRPLTDATPADLREAFRSLLDP